MIARHLKSPALIALMVTMESQLRSGQSDVEEQTNMMVMKWTPTRASVVFLQVVSIRASDAAHPTFSHSLSASAHGKKVLALRKRNPGRSMAQECEKPSTCL